ncbi:MAG: two-component system response regulator, partial [Rhizobiaceae bacterium]
MMDEGTLGDLVPGKDHSLLIVDDDRPFLTRLARAMEGRGFDVETAESVEDAVAKVKT